MRDRKANDFREPCRSRRKEARIFLHAEAAQTQSLLTSPAVYVLDARSESKVEATHDRHPRTIAELANSAMVLRRRFMVTMRERVLVAPMNRLRRGKIAELINSAIILTSLSSPDARRKTGGPTHP
jgi:hypothetical protein